MNPIISVFMGLAAFAFIAFIAFGIVSIYIGQGYRSENSTEGEQ